MRILQWLCDETHECRVGTFCGGVGDDQRASILEKLVQIAGVDVRYVINKVATNLSGVYCRIILYAPYIQDADKSFIFVRC